MLSQLITIKEVPTPVDLFLRQAEAYLRDEAWEKAIAACERSLALDQNQANTYKVKGDIFQRMGHTAEALGCYAESLLLRPDYPDVYVSLGQLYSAIEEWEQAATYYQTATEIDPGFVDAYRYLAQVWDHLDQPTDYMDTLYQSLSLSPETFTADEHCEMGQLLLGQGQEYEAIACFERAIELDADHAEAQANLQPLWEKQEKGELVAPNVEEHYPLLLSEDADPSEEERADAIEALVVLARSYIEHGNVEKAIAYYEHAFRLDSQNLTLYQEIMAALFNVTIDGKAQITDKIADKIADIQYQAIRATLTGVSAHTCAELGDRLLHQGNSSEAIECYRQAIQVEPDNIELFKKLIHSLKITGLLKDAAQAYLELAQVLKGKHHHRDAIALLHNALAWLRLEIHQSST